MQVSFSVGFAGWLTINYKSKSLSNHYNIPWKTVFCTALWCIWICRNQLIHDHADVYTTNDLLNSLPSKIFHKAVETIFSIGKQTNMGSTKVCHFVKWSPPLNGWFTLNIDGAVKKNPGLARAGGSYSGLTGKMGARVLCWFGSY